MRRRLAILVAALALLAAIVLLWPRSIGGRTGSRAGGGTDAHERTSSGWWGWGSRHDDDAASKEPSAIEGTVVTRDGAAVDGALVAAFNLDDDNRTVPRGTAVSSAGGHFRIEPLTAGSYFATATSDTHRPASKSPLTVRAGEATRGVVLMLGGPGVSLHGRVAEQSGGAIPGARVCAGRSSSDEDDLFCTVAAGDGTYRLTLPAGRFFADATAAGYVRASRSADLVKKTDVAMDFTMIPGARLSGVVIDKGSRKPVADARVTADPASRDTDARSESATSGEDGRFVFDDLVAGDWTLSARHASFIGHAAPVALTIAGEAPPVTIELVAAHSVSGTAVDEEGSPVSGAKITLSESGRWWSSPVRAVSAADGAFKIEGIGAGRYRAAATLPGWVSRGSEEVAVETTDVEGITLTLEPSAHIEGRVTDAAGKPVEGAAVRADVEGGDDARGPGGRGRGGRGRGRDPFGRGRQGAWDSTREDGTYHLDVGAGTVTVSATHEVLGLASAAPFEIAPSDKKRVDLTLAAGASISGVVRQDDGSPAAAAHVSALVRGEGFRYLETDAADDGSYEIPSLDAGTWSVSARRARGDGAFTWPSTDAARKNVEVAAGAHIRGVDLVVPRGGKKIRGVVTASGSGVADAEIAVSGSGGGRPRVYSGPNGAFTVEDLEDGMWTLKATRPGFAPASKEAAAGATDVTLELTPESSIAGTVTGSDGPVTDGTIAIFATGERSPRVTVPLHDSGGAFVAHGLAAGTWTLVASTADARTGSASTTLTTGEHKDGVVIRVSQGFTLRGKFVDFTTGAPLTTGRIAVQGNFGDARDLAGDGSFEIKGLPTHWSVVLVVIPDFSRYRGDSYQLTSGEDGEVRDLGTLRLVSNASHEDGDGRVGLSAWWKDGVDSVFGVKPGSQAAAAGISIGDRIVTIDSKDSTGVGVSGMGRLLGGPPGTKVDVGVTKADGTGARSVTLTRVATSI